MPYKPDFDQFPALHKSRANPILPSHKVSKTEMQSYCVSKTIPKLDVAAGLEL